MNENQCKAKNGKWDEQKNNCSLPPKVKNKSTNIRVIISIFVSIAFVIGGYFLVNHVYDACKVAAMDVIPPVFNLLACTVGTPLYILFTTIGTTLIGSGAWMFIAAIKKLLFD
jgi:hypothetical protein